MKAVKPKTSFNNRNPVEKKVLTSLLVAYMTVN